MKPQPAEHEQLISALDAAVAEAETFFRGTDENLRAGEQTARKSLAQLIFWHLEYVHVVEALVAGRVYSPTHGTLTELNALAARQVPDEPMRVLARRLSYRQKQLAKRLRRLTDWSLSFPLRADDTSCSVAGRILRAEAHIRSQVARLRRAARQNARAAGVIGLGAVDGFALPGARHYF